MYRCIIEQEEELEEIFADGSWSNQETTTTDDYNVYLPAYLVYLSLGFRVISAVITVLMSGWVIVIIKITKCLHKVHNIFVDHMYQLYHIYHLYHIYQLYQQYHMYLTYHMYQLYHIAIPCICNYVCIVPIFI